MRTQGEMMALAMAFRQVFLAEGQNIFAQDCRPAAARALHDLFKYLKIKAYMQILWSWLSRDSISCIGIDMRYYFNNL